MLKSTDRRVNDKVNYVGLKPVVKRNFYALATDKKGKTVLHTIENVTKLQAKNAGIRWARQEGLAFQGVYSN